MPETSDDSVDGEKHKRSIFEDWTPEDGKLLIITTAATVTANIVTIIIVALALIISRSFRPNPSTPKNYIWFLGISAIPVLTAYVAFYSLYRTRREEDDSPYDGIRKWALVITGLGTGFLALLYILSWIGFAVGVK